MYGSYIECVILGGHVNVCVKGVNISLCVGVADSCDGARGWRLGHT